MRIFLLLAAALALPSVASAQSGPPAPPAPSALSAPPGAGAKAADVKVNQVIVYGQDACPQSSDQEITICARMPESERYRIPPALRDDPANPARDSWNNKVERMELAGKTGIGSCSPVGPGAGAGCLGQLIREWEQEYTKGDVNWTRLVEEARAKRVSTIDADSEKIDRDIRATEGK
jgi:hypothetical protein